MYGRELHLSRQYGLDTRLTLFVLENRLGKESQTPRSLSLLARFEVSELLLTKSNSLFLLLLYEVPKMSNVRITVFLTGLLILSAATVTTAQDPASQLAPTDANTESNLTVSS